MIKRIVGLLAAAAVLAVVVFAILGSGTYSSFIGLDRPHPRRRLGRGTRRDLRCGTRFDVRQPRERP